MDPVMQKNNIIREAVMVGLLYPLRVELWLDYKEDAYG
jgi:hypothetical protein